MCCASRHECFHVLIPVPPFLLFRQNSIGFLEIEGLDSCTELRCLYLQENCISEIKNLDKLESLDTINLAKNQVKVISGLKNLTKLNTLNLEGNSLKHASDLEGLLECPSIGVLDLQNNRIEDVEVIDTLVQLQNLKVLYLKNNPVVSKIKDYRKVLISKLKNLTYLDDRPVFENERRTAEAWAAGGSDGEKKERESIRFEKSEKERKNHEAFERMLAQAKARAAREREELGESAFDRAYPEPEEGAKIVEIVEDEGSVPELEKIDQSFNKIEIIEEDELVEDSTFLTQQTETKVISNRSNTTGEQTRTQIPPTNDAEAMEDFLTSID